jgi:hypothetical protein
MPSIPLPQGTEFLLDLIAGLWVPFCYIGVFIFRILLALWVKRDAENHDMSPEWWMIGVLISGVFGVIIYLWFREKWRY